MSIEDDDAVFNFVLEDDLELDSNWAQGWRLNL